jgi:hypothetical protein
MQLFKCDHCNHPVYFDNAYCNNCGSTLGFFPEKMEMLALKVPDEGSFISHNYGISLNFCFNYSHDVCNWVIPADQSNPFCPACQLNGIIPNLSKSEYRDRWKVIEQAKHRLVYTLLRWQLPIVSKSEDWQGGLIFNFKSDDHMPAGDRVLTGHADGVITMNIAEANDVEREMAKKQMAEVYRTVLGHLRHEVGHYYWERLVMNSELLWEFRELFGDERQSYQTALENQYQHGPPADWGNSFISSYATMHPWEDWAETWAHYLHIVDTLETAYSFGTKIHPRMEQTGKWLSSDVDENAYYCKDFNKIIGMWIPLSVALNSLNRSMGAKDIYPFVINPSVIKKLAFVHRVIQGNSDC